MWGAGDMASSAWEPPVAFRRYNLRQASAIPNSRPRAHDAPGAVAWPDAQPSRTMPLGRF